MKTFFMQYLVVGLVAVECGLIYNFFRFKDKMIRYFKLLDTHVNVHFCLKEFLFCIL